MDYLDAELAKFSKDDIKATIATTLAIPFSVNKSEVKLDSPGSSILNAGMFSQKRLSTSVFNLPIVVGFQLSQEMMTLKRARSKSCDYPSGSYDQQYCLFKKEPTYQSFYASPSIKVISSSLVLLP